MSYAVVRMQKMKAHDLKGIQVHNQRERESRTNSDIDKERSHENYDLVHDGKI
ncbi:plasmid recombination protein, partial [Bacillus subtilis]